MSEFSLRAKKNLTLVVYEKSNRYVVKIRAQKLSK